MKVNKVEFIGEVCDCDHNHITTCRTGISSGCISSLHRGFEMITIRMWVDKEHFSGSTKELLKAGKYRITIEKIEDTNAG